MLLDPPFENTPSEATAPKGVEKLVSKIKWSEIAGHLKLWPHLQKI